MPTSKVKLNPVESRQLSDMGYDPDTQTLAIMFKQKGGRSKPYHYPNVTQAQFDELASAKSKGGHFNSTFKANPSHPHEKIVETDDERAERKSAEEQPA